MKPMEEGKRKNFGTSVKTVGKQERRFGTRDDTEETPSWIERKLKETLEKKNVTTRRDKTENVLGGSRQGIRTKTFDAETEATRGSHVEEEAKRSDEIVRKTKNENTITSPEKPSYTCHDLTERRNYYGCIEYRKINELTENAEFGVSPKFLGLLRTIDLVDIF